MTSQDDHYMDTTGIDSKAEAAGLEQEVHPSEKSANLSSEVMQNTIHELRLQQLKLEKQIEELRASQTHIISKQTLRDQREFSESLIETAQAIILVLDTQGCIVRFNPFMEQLVGYSLEEVKGLNWFETFLKPEIGHTIKSFFQLTIADANTKDKVNPIITKDGRTVVVEWSNKTLKDKNGEAVGILAIGQDITERIQTEEALRKSEKFLKSTIDGLSAHIAVLDDQGEIILVNQAYRDFGTLNGGELGTLSEGGNYLTVCDTVTGERSAEAASFAQGIREVLKGQRQSFELEYPCHSPDENRWFIARVTSICGEGPRCAIVAHENITERKRIELQLVRDNILLKTQQEASLEGILIVDENDNIISFNQHFCKIWEIPDYIMAEQSSEKAMQYVLPLLMNPNEFVKRIRDLYQDKKASSFEEIVLANGKILARHSAPMIDFDDQYYGRVWFYRDITSHKNAETALLNEKKFSEDTLNALPGVFYMFDADGRFVRWNDQFREVTGYTDDELATMQGPDFFSGDDKRRVEEAMQRVFVDGRSEVEAAFQTKDGRLLPYHLQGQYRSVGGQSFLLGIGIDITERKQADEALRFAANVFTHAREGITITDRDANILDVNTAFTNITGYSREEVLGKNPRILSSGKQDKAFYADMWHDLLSKSHWSGEVWNRRKDDEVIAEILTISAVHDEHGDVQNYIALFSDITAIKKHQSQLEYIAHYDALTGLPNRLLLGDRLRQAMIQEIRRGQHLAVAYLDLDGFKGVNDTHGHGVGDQLLATLAKRMSLVLRDGDTLGRLGGDEFVAVLVDLVDVEASIPILTRLLEAVAQPFPVGNIVLNVSASLGVTFYPQSEAVNADQLLRQADQAMYQAKQAGKNRYHAFDAVQDRNVRGHHESLEHIRQAMLNRQFVLFYQPKVNMRTGEVIGSEALIRWQHPKRGLLLPAAFLPAIENHPLSIELGTWVIDSALLQIEAFREDRLPIPISVNVGALQLQHPDFVSCLRMLLARHPGVNPGELELEILETSALASYSGVSQVMASCQALGVGFALDDFGTGYSSLTYLKQLPAGLLKIDQSFVRDMLDDSDDLAILEGVLGLATAFRRQVIAEGVETIAHGEMLLRLGCEWAQGYAIARPMPANQFKDWVNAWDAPPTWKTINPISKDRLPVLSAAVEHSAWILEMVHYLSGNRDQPPALDAYQCRLGHWLDHGGRALLLGEGTDQLVDVLHREIHCLAAELTTMKRDGCFDEVQNRISELHILRDQLLDQLSELY